MPAAPGNASVENAIAADAASGAAPDAEAMLTLARVRLADELERLPPWGSPLLRARLFAAPTPEGGVSYGALVHFIRRAVAVGDTSFAHDLFTLLLQRIEKLNRRWATRTLSGGAQNSYEELRQELALRLWVHIGRGDHASWELFFQRALSFEQRRLGARFLERLRPPPGMAGASPETLFGHLGALHASQRWNGVEQALRYAPLIPAQTAQTSLASLTLTEFADRRDPFAAADLADLRSQVALLPIRERQATLLRFWCDASEAEIARALGGVTTRTVRNLLTRAYIRLRRLYAPESSEVGAPAFHQQEGGRRANHPIG